MVFPPYHSYKIETSYTLQEVLQRLEQLIVNKEDSFVAQVKNARLLYGDLNEDGFSLSSHYPRWRSMMLFFGKFEYCSQGISIHTKFRYAHTLNLPMLIAALFLTGIIIKGILAANWSADFWAAVEILSVFTVFYITIFVFFGLCFKKTIFKILFSEKG